ncbi:MAG: hypothetical protein HUU20_21825 [Pirellulales bacterium]|nr:hypothetical protein [Pirellulales bacterium]
MKPVRHALVFAFGLVCAAQLAAAEPAAWLLDMGSDQSPLWAGFTRVTPATTYDAGRGYGWLNPPEDLRANEAELVDALGADNIWGKLNKRIGFQLDLPDGRYTVFVLTGAMGNVVHLRYLRAAHEWTLQGKIAGRIEPAEEELFRTANYDWRKGDDAYDHFVRPRYQWLKHDATASEGRLEIGFNSGLDFPVAAMIVVPHEHTQKAEKAVLRLEAERRAAFHQLWAQLPQPADPPAPVSDPQRERGYVVAAVDCDDDLHPWSQPAADASRREIAIFAAAGEQEQASLAVFASRDLDQVGIETSDLRSREGHAIPAAAIERGLVQFTPWPARGSRRHAQYWIQECLILPHRPTWIGAGTCKRFWLTVRVPPGTPPGVFEGRITVSAAGAPSASLELKLRVLPFALAVPPLEHFMYFGSMYHLAGFYMPRFDEQRYWDSMREEVRFARDNDFCRAECIVGRWGGGRSSDFKIEDGRVTDVDLSDTEKLMRLLRDENAWPRDNAMICRTEPMLYLGGGRIATAERRLTFCPTPEGRANFIRAVQIIDRKARQAGWPEVVFDCFGEYTNFGEEGKQFGLAVHASLKEAGVLNTLRGNGASDMACVLEGLVAIPQPNWAMMRTEWLDFMKKHSRRLWAYNYAESRFAFGWFSFKHGFQRGSYESGVYANGQPGNPFDTETMFPMGLPLAMTRIAPALWLKRLVEGGDDYRYLYTLDRLLADAQPSTSEDARRAAGEARKWLDEKLATVPNGLDRLRADPRDFGNVQGDLWPKHVLGRYRQEAAEHIIAVRKALGRTGR